MSSDSDFVIRYFARCEKRKEQELLIGEDRRRQERSLINIVVATVRLLPR